MVQHIDLAPTILDTIGFTDKNGCGQGRTLYNAIKERVSCNEHVFAESQLKTKLPHFLSVRSLTHKFIRIRSGKFDLKRPFSEGRQRLVWAISKPRMLFDLRKDPEETINLVRREPAIVLKFQESAEAISRENAQRAKMIRSGDNSTQTDEAVASQLKALGYFDE